MSNLGNQGMYSTSGYCDLGNSEIDFYTQTNEPGSTQTELWGYNSKDQRKIGLRPASAWDPDYDDKNNRIRDF